MKTRSPFDRWPGYCASCLAPLDLEAIAAAVEDGREARCSCGRLLVPAGK